MKMSQITYSDLDKLPRDSFYVISNGKLVENWKLLTKNDVFHVIPRVLGGKGGFGSLLRSFGSQFYKSTNQDMCRDLTGRRLKDVKEEEKLKKYINKANEREEARRKKAEQKYEKLKKLDSRNGNPSTHQLDDPEYGKTKQQISDKTEDAVRAGLKLAAATMSASHDDSDQPGSSGASTSRKRPPSPIADKVLNVKKQKRDLWLGMDDFEDSGSDSDLCEPSINKTIVTVDVHCSSSSKISTDV